MSIWYGVICGVEFRVGHQDQRVAQFDKMNAAVLVIL